jgi:ABC-type dipeptide/oligopeptide/nickel transport system ATPase subunit
MSLIGTGLTYSPPGHAVVLSDVSLTLAPGAVLGLGGGSGAGKSTLGRILAGHVMPDRGSVTADGAALDRIGQPRIVQYAPQSPELATDPRWTVGRILANGIPPTDEVLATLGIQPGWHDRFPAELSGGELQRVSLARLLGPATRYLICDEITAQLDALSQAQLWAGLVSMCTMRGIGLLVISHEPLLRKRLTAHSLMLDAGQLTALAA